LVDEFKSVTEMRLLSEPSRLQERKAIEESAQDALKLLSEWFKLLDTEK
jgi:hypothetical protein